jgi:tRNA (guanine-N7-)-methyltransferase
MEVDCLPESWGLAPPPADCWRQIFDNDRPVAVEIGPGRGEFLVASARQTAAQNFYAIERSAARARAIAAKLARAGVDNARVIAGDAVCVIDMLPPACVAAFHIQFPDPWWKRRHHKRRLWTPHFVSALRRALVVDGTIELTTDVGTSFALAGVPHRPGPGSVTVWASPEAATSFARRRRGR